jgi:hypothetical protein
MAGFRFECGRARFTGSDRCFSRCNEPSASGPALRPASAFASRSGRSLTGLAPSVTFTPILTSGGSAMGSISIACYKPRPGCEQALLELVRNHLPPLRAEGLVTNRAPIVCAPRMGPSSRFSSECRKKPSPAQMETRPCGTCGRSSRRSAGTRRPPIWPSFKTCSGTSSRSEPLVSPGPWLKLLHGRWITATDHCRTIGPMRNWRGCLRRSLFAVIQAG